MVDGIDQATLFDYQVIQVSLFGFNSTAQAARTCADNDDILYLGFRDHGIESILSDSFIDSPLPVLFDDQLKVSLQSLGGP